MRITTETQNDLLYSFALAKQKKLLQMKQLFLS